MAAAAGFRAEEDRLMTRKGLTHRFRRSTTAGAILVPPDPREALDGPLDPALIGLRSAVLPHRRRLWIRRLVRRGWLAIAVLIAAELVLWTVARFVPIESAPLIAAAIPVVVMVGWVVAGVRCRPRVGEAALAIDAEAGLGDRVSSALELAVGFPASARPLDSVDVDTAGETATPLDEAAETDRFVRRQRDDAVRALRGVPAGLFAPRLSAKPAAVAVVATLLLVPALLLPNPQDAAIAQQRQVREAAERQA
jgi:hypothetical protein